MGPKVWVHAPSVGEFNTVRPLLELLSPEVEWFLSFSSPRAEGFLRSKLSDRRVYKLFPPVGLKVSKLLKEEKPEVLLLVEGDRYPALLGAPVEAKFFVNARLSDRSYGFLRFFRGVFVPKLNTFRKILCKDEETCERFESLGVRSEVLVPCGNLKAVLKPPEGELNLSFPEGTKVWVAGSTHPPEEREILTAFKEVLKRFPNAVLVLAPRHPTRAGEVFKLTLSFFPEGEAALRSSVSGTFKGKVLVVDTFGELLNFYRAADAAFVGGSLVKVGGHNLLEPAYFGKPVLYGPFVDKFRDLEGILRKLGLAFPVKDWRELALRVVQVFKNPPRAKGSLRDLSREVLNCYRRELPFLAT
ncbi:MAG: hypothetical protein GXO08_05205 [Aquificae bacterium]|nr:hypothetical protein [Aquificota bacterium]